MINNIYENIPTWDNGVWTSTSFDTREDFASFVRNLFKKPGEYYFDKTSRLGSVKKCINSKSKTCI